ncbi:MAG: hypothetical protein DME13_24395 [Candidatus Rokuibacteriota bacterium]|nr:MAG: hypothetical protein DME13_24395 [Candidatus Rokubacteria bacterium]
MIFLIRHGETVGNASRTVQLPDSHVFVYREALDELIRDVDAAAQAMWDWIATRAPDLAEAPRRGPHQDTPP